MNRTHLLDRPGGYVTDGGMETDLIFHHGVDLPQFAAFPLLDDPDGRRLLRDYYDGYARIAARYEGVRDYIVAHYRMNQRDADRGYWRDAAGLDWDLAHIPTLVARHAGDCEALAAAIVAAVCAHRGHDQTQDDVTVFVLRRSA